MSRRLGWMLLSLVLSLLSACAGQRVVLLPGPDGRAGAVVVRSAQAEQRLDQPFASLEVARDGQLKPVTLSADQVKARYGQLLAAQAPRPMSFVVRFELGSATALSADSQPVLEAMLKAVAQWPAPQVSVVGHTDSLGSDSINDELSLQRARTVAELLIQRGVPAGRIEVAARGAREPLVQTERGVANATNRRVEIILR